MTRHRILVAGIGNIFLGDDGFGVEVVRRLATRRLPDSVRLVDFGIRGFDLALALLDGYDAAILIDATPRGGQPGTLYVIEPDPEVPHQDDPPEMTLATHGMDPVKVLRLVLAMGGNLNRVLVVGCEPAALEPDADGQIGLSESVHAAVDEAIRLVESLVADITTGDPEQQSRLAATGGDTCPASL
jgi:hydrogenase maturation protease